MTDTEPFDTDGTECPECGHESGRIYPKSGIVICAKCKCRYRF